MLLYRIYTKKINKNNKSKIKKKKREKKNQKIPKKKLEKTTKKYIKTSKVWQMFTFCHPWLWHEYRCLYVISLIIYDRKSHATGQIKTKICLSL